MQHEQCKTKAAAEWQLPLLFVIIFNIKLQLLR